MSSEAKTVEEYLNSLPYERQEPMRNLRNIILQNLPIGFEEGMQYGMIGYYVPFNIYPAGYHCDKKQPLPFASIASQKNSINIYNLGLYINEEIMNWYMGEYPKYIKTKPDMGKSCLRFKKAENLPYQLIAELMQKISVEEYIMMYEKAYKISTI